MFVKCIYVPKTKIPYQRVRIGKSYLCVGIEYSGYRIVDDDGEPILYSKKWFERIDHYPKNWIKTEYPDGQYFIYPPELQESFFFPKWFDHDPVILRRFKDYIDSIIQELDPKQERRCRTEIRKVSAIG
jgi:hypothetical protein